MKRLLVILALCLCISGVTKEIVIDPEHTMVMDDEITQQLTDAGKRFVTKQESEGAKEILILINSPGGSIVDGISFADTIKNSKLKTVCLVDGLAASMAAVTLQYCSERYATQSSVIMFHNGSTSMSGNVAFMSSELEFVNKISKMMDSVVADRLGISYDDLKTHQNTEWWLVGADEAKKAHAIDDSATVTLKAAPPASPTSGAVDPLQELIKTLSQPGDAPDKQEVPRKVNSEGFRHMLENLK